MPQVSVIMPCFNHARFVAESVSCIMRQTHEDLELIITDDCSSDNSWEIIRALAGSDRRIKPLRHEHNQGASKSRNDGLRAATGRLIGFCDADDLWEPDKLEFQLKQLEQNPDRDIAYCDSLIIDEQGLPTGQRFSDLYPPARGFEGRLFPELLVRNFINMQSVLMRKKCVERAGGFDEGIKWVEDWWYWVRLSRDHRFAYSERPLARYRVHSGNSNRVQKRGCCVNRFKVFRRILSEFPDLTPAAKASVLFQMGVELCGLEKHRVGRGVLWSAVVMSLTDLRAFVSSCRALRRLMLCAVRH